MPGNSTFPIKNPLYAVSDIEVAVGADGGGVHIGVVLLITAERLPAGAQDGLKAQRVGMTQVEHRETPIKEDQAIVGCGDDGPDGLEVGHLLAFLPFGGVDDLGFEEEVRLTVGGDAHEGAIASAHAPRHVERAIAGDGELAGEGFGQIQGALFALEAGGDGSHLNLPGLQDLGIGQDIALGEGGAAQTVFAHSEQKTLSNAKKYFMCSPSMVTVNADPEPMTGSCPRGRNRSADYRPGVWGKGFRGPSPLGVGVMISVLMSLRGPLTGTSIACFFISQGAA